MISLAGSIATAPSLAADSLGRLFFTPAQRNVLDAGKSLSKVAPVAPGPRTVFLNGVVTRSDAERTVWVNGKAYHDASPDGVQIKTDPAAPGVAAVGAPDANANASVKLRVGQQLERATGKVSETHRNTAVEAKASGNASIGASATLAGSGTPPKADDPSPRRPER